MPKPQRQTLSAISDIATVDDAEIYHQLDPAVIRLDGGAQMREGINQTTIDNYAEVMVAENGFGPFPPIKVFYDGENYWLADGFHRVNAAIACGPMIVQTVTAKVTAGDRRAAVLYAVGANHNHGLPRTAATKRRAVETLLLDAEWQQWSDREIARRCNVSPDTVGRIRRELSLSESDSQPKAERTYTTRHGSTATMKTANIGRTVPKPSLSESDSEREQQASIHATGKPLLSMEPVQSDSTTRLVEMKRLYESTLETLEEFEKETGFYAHRKPMRENLRTMIEIIDRKIEAKRGYRINPL